MAVGRDSLPTLRAVAGVRLATAAVGVGKPGRDDLTLIAIDEGATTSAVFTRNRFRAAPVRVAEAHRSAATPRYLLINTGNANAGTGADGEADAEACCRALAEQAGCAPAQVLPFSTGVIGEPLPVARIETGLPELLSGLSADGWPAAAWAIGTTDTRSKGASETLEIAGQRVTVTGIAKGAGMIRPNMATMLAFVATDAELPQWVADGMLRAAVDASFNRITVDGDTSTNDACTLVATGRSGARIDAATSDVEQAAFRAALGRVCTALARAIVRDGEGASRELIITVRNAVDEAEAVRVGRTVAESPLVKTAVFAGDPNWGRILAAVGRAGIDDLDAAAVQIALDDYVIADHGGRVEGYVEAEAAHRMAGDEVRVGIDLRRGEAAATVWGCDLSYEYVRINADYRS